MGGTCLPHGTEQPSCGWIPSGTWGLFLLPEEELSAGKQLLAHLSSSLQQLWGTTLFLRHDQP